MIRFGAQWTEPNAPDPDRVRAAIRSAMTQAALFARALWYQRAQDLHIRRSGDYLNGIATAEIRVASETNTGTQMTVVYEIVNTAKHARLVEHGHAAFSLPRAIDWSNTRGSIKHGPKGPYLHIAFRHAAFQTQSQMATSGATLATIKSMLPQRVHDLAKRLRFTTPTRTGPIHNSGGGFVARDRYSRAGPHSRIDEGKPTASFVGSAHGLHEVWRTERTVRGRDMHGKTLTNPAWSHGKHQGLFKGGTKGHSSFMTVRTITPRSAGWNIPAEPGHHVAAQVAAALNGGVGHERFLSLLREAAAEALRGG